MMVCCVEGCRGPDTPNPVFFEFPSSRLLRKRWLDAIRQPEGAGAVCIRHFARADYELVRGEARLRSRVVPTRRIGESVNDASESDSDSGSESDSDGSATSDRTREQTNKNDRTHDDNEDHGKTNDDDGKTKDGTGNGTKRTDDNGNKNGVEDKTHAVTEKDNTDDEKCSQNATENDRLNNDDIVNNDNQRLNEKLTEDNGNNEKLKTDEHGKVSQDNGITNDDSEKINDGCDKTNDGSDKTNDASDKTNDASDKTNDASDKTNDASDKTNDASDKTNDGSGETKDDSGKTSDDSKNSVKKVQGRKTRCKITALRAVNGRKYSFSSDSTNSDTDSVSSSSRRAELESSKEDIEEALQHYYIENKKTERQVAAMSDVINEQQGKQTEESKREEIEEPEASAPVFIELSVGQPQGSASQEPTESDCLMLLESVQCDVDPSMLLAVRAEEEANMEQVDLDDDDDDDDEPVVVEKKKEDPISLLTSSDEDDVILQEPKYDLVEVSSADTSEDDLPLVKLVKNQPVAKKMKLTDKQKKTLITKLLWGGNDFYCVQCNFTTSISSEYTSHMSKHSKIQSQNQKIIQYCQDCGFTTCSKHQMLKHKQKHKNEKRFKCQKCNYSAKHKMSLVYHMKTHKNNEVEIAICGTFDPKKSKASEGKRYKCGECEYSTNRRSDLRRHRVRRHDPDDADDDEYVP